jgi:hypothetical protein
MSGLLRRFRRPKPKEDEEEPTDSARERSGDDADIYPHRRPGRKSDPDIEPEPEPRVEPSSDDDVLAEPPVVDDEIGPAEPVELPVSEAAESPPEGPTPPAPQPPAVDPTPDGLVAGRPPLPEADAGSGRPVHRPLSPPTRCFLCGTEMNGAYCPTCRMNWNE